jgi:hypothetical protein
VERDKALPKDDQELARLLLSLSAEGLTIREKADVKEVRSEGGRISVNVRGGWPAERDSGDTPASRSHNGNGHTSTCLSASVALAVGAK